jgi:ATP-binding cassette, sub-family E, member 1
MSHSNRIAIVNKERCKPTKCQKECMKKCPPMRNGKKVIELVDIEDIYSPAVASVFNDATTNNKHKIAKIVESMCIGCNGCVVACPFDAIKIVQLPKENPKEIIHRYGLNGFRLYRLPIMKKNCVQSLIGQNGIGKSTILDILSGTLTPNFERAATTIINTSQHIINHFKGTVMMNYFKDLYSSKLTFSFKSQKIKSALQSANKTMLVRDYIVQHDLSFETSTFCELGLDVLLDNAVHTLSGGELQRLLCWMTAAKKADVYIFDEPSNFLDVKQRLIVAKMIRSLVSSDTYVLIVEHDLSMLDYISDEINILYGEPGAYGIVSNSLSISNGLNEYLEGYLSSQNIRFRSEPFHLSPLSQIGSTYAGLTLTATGTNTLTYAAQTIRHPGFILHIPAAKLQLGSAIHLILGENGVGKTTFMNSIVAANKSSISYKPQHTNLARFAHKDGTYPTVLELFYRHIRTAYLEPTFQTNVSKLLDMKPLENRGLDELSGGELQRVMLCFALGTPAAIYLLDEPSSNLDIETRLACIKVVKRFSQMSDKAIFIIEHDIMMAVSWAQEPGSSILFIRKTAEEAAATTKFVKSKTCQVSEPMNFKHGINAFLKEMNISMRISGHNRPRINKMNSQMDTQQKNSEMYYGNA